MPTAKFPRKTLFHSFKCILGITKVGIVTFSFPPFPFQWPQRRCIGTEYLPQKYRGGIDEFLLKWMGRRKANYSIPYSFLIPSQCHLPSTFPFQSIHSSLPFIRPSKFPCGDDLHLFLPFFTFPIFAHLLEKTKKVGRTSVGLAKNEFFVQSNFIHP